MAAGLAHAIAVENAHVTADAIEAQEFPDLAARYQVMGVPKTVVNDAVEFVGAVPEDEFVRHVLEAAGEPG
jgi:predicted DsbA family dithiol-disulfide isomerase